jgi:hypothetical protein
MEYPSLMIPRETFVNVANMDKVYELWEDFQIQQWRINRPPISTLFQAIEELGEYRVLEEIKRLFG